jgi:hypothetical protein
MKMSTSKKTILLVLAFGLAMASAVFLIGSSQRSRTIAQGCFHQVAHKGSGCAALVQRPDGKTVLQLTDFATADSADLCVVLISAPDALENKIVKDSKKLDLGPLHSAQGFQEYVVPEGENLADFHSVTIWNVRYEVNFTTAPLAAL